VDRSFTQTIARDSFGLAAPVRDSKMQPFTFDFLRVGICDPRMTAIAEHHFQTLFGERPFTGVDRSLARRIASDAFGSGADRHERLLTGTRFFWLWRAEAAQR
jgi:hypothetical protein